MGKWFQMRIDGFTSCAWSSTSYYYRITMSVQVVDYSYLATKLNIQELFVSEQVGKRASGLYTIGIRSILLIA